MESYIKIFFVIYIGAVLICLAFLYNQEKNYHYKYLDENIGLKDANKELLDKLRKAEEEYKQKLSVLHLGK